MGFGNTSSCLVLLKPRQRCRPITLPHFASFCFALREPHRTKSVPYLTLQMISSPYLTLLYPTPPSYSARPYSTQNTFPHRTLLYPTLRYPTVPYPTRLYPTPPHPTVPYGALLSMHASFNLGRESNASLSTPRNPSWHLATTLRRICARYRNCLYSLAASPRHRCSDDCVLAGISKLNRSRFAKSATKKEQRKTTHAHMLLTDLLSGDVDLVSPVFKEFNSVPPSSDASHLMRIQFTYIM